jgi:bacteriocin biosynthesis cyclodehydratase domain-containing protein
VESDPQGRTRQHTEAVQTLGGSRQTLDLRAPGLDDRLRLQPHLTLLRRDDRDLQLGFDAADAVVIADPDGSLHTLLGLLDGRYRLGELTDAAVRLGVPVEQVAGLVATLAAAGLLQRAPSVGTEALTLRLVGLGPAGTRIGDQLLRAGVGRVVVVDPDSSTPWAGWAHGRDRVQVADHWSAPSTEPVDLTVVVATCLETDRAVTTELTRAGHPHLLVRPRARGAVVGPLVLPGRTSCVACADLARTRTDPAWPRMLAQLCRTRGEWDPLAADWAAASVTTQALSHLAGRTVETASATVELGPHAWSWQRRVWSADPACGCCWSPRAEW